MARLVYSSKRNYKHISRYAPYRTIINRTTNTTYLESPNTYLTIEDLDTVYHIVEPYQAGRLDIISNIYYKTPQHFWAIAWANNIIDPLTIVAGTVLVIPSLDSLYNQGGPLNKS